MRGDRLALALRMVMRRPLRSALAALGLAISVSALLVAVALADKGKNSALSEIRQIGANILTVNAEASRNRGARARTRDVVKTLTLLDAREVERRIGEVLLVAAEYRSVVPVKVNDLARQAAVSGIDPSYARLREAPMRSGRFFDEGDDAEGMRVAVLGGRLAADLFAGADPIGESIRVRGMPFTVIGVFNERGTGLDAFDEDEVVFIPLKTAMRRVFQADYVHRLFVRVRESDALDRVSTEIDTLLKGRHHIMGEEPLDFRVQDQRRLVTLRQTAVSRLGAFQIAVSIALLGAGALGIFALQLLSARERRAEIGTRRAIGATYGMIFEQFLLEATMVCVLGATGGIVLGAVAVAVAQATLAPRLAATAFVACCASGVLASVAPARGAAAVHPAVALRG